MSEQGLRRPLLLAAGGLVAVSLLYLNYRHYLTGTAQDHKIDTKLHRSNAVRRARRRRWRPGHEPQVLPYDPTDRAIANLHVRNNAGFAYGNYINTHLDLEVAGSESLWAGDADLGLYPRNLKAVLDAVCAFVTPSEEEKEQYWFHIQSMFVQNFVLEEYPAGYVVGQADAERLMLAIQELGVRQDVISHVVGGLDRGATPVRNYWSPTNVDHEARPANDGADDDLDTDGLISALSNQGLGPESIHQTSSHDEEDGNQDFLNLLYTIAGEQAKREGFIHRGVECNSCGACPIQGIRYHCANCFDYDLCENCESQQVHTRNHVFFKIRIPAPTRGHIKQVIPKWYPGKPQKFPDDLPKTVSKPLLSLTGMDKTEMEASYEQFKCLAGCEWDTDPSGLGMAIDRKGFDMYFTARGPEGRGPPNLIYDRIFAFYDTDNNGFIGFNEFICGIANLADKSRRGRLERIFRGYDLNGDGYVDRKDFLRMFRAYYELNKELNREMIMSQDDFVIPDDEMRAVISGSQPISGIFQGSSFVGHRSMAGIDKRPTANGDLEIVDGPNEVLQRDSDMSGDRQRVIGNSAMGNMARAHPFKSFRQEPSTDEPVMSLPIAGNFELIGISHADDAATDDLTGEEPTLQAWGWPPLVSPEPGDVVAALGEDIPVEEIMDPVDRARVFLATSERLDQESDKTIEDKRQVTLNHRWEKRQFYLDVEEGMSKPNGYKPPGYVESDSSDDEGQATPGSHHGAKGSSRRQSMRSRSSSKVRFDDSAMDTDHETRSNTSRSDTAGERWGGYEFSRPEEEVGKEILYQAVQQGFNELLDPLFKAKEDEAIEAMRSRPLRARWAHELEDYEQKIQKKESDLEAKLYDADMKRTEEMLAGLSNPEPVQSSEAVQSPAPDPDDHIEIMFGVEGLTNRTLVAEVMFGDADVVVGGDPTLPQNRPNDDEATPSVSAATSMKPQREHPPTEEDLRKWAGHKKIEEEKRRRGGFGRLSIKEFARKMVPENEVETVLGSRDRAGEDDVEFWGSTADLGRLSFLGTWLEMATF